MQFTARYSVQDTRIPLPIRPFCADSLFGTLTAYKVRMKNNTKYSFERIGSSLGGFVEIRIDTVTTPGGQEKVRPDWRPPIDIGEDSSEYLIVAEVPGVDPDSISINCKDAILQIVCEASRDAQEERKRYFKAERALGIGQRSFRIPEDADDSKVNWQTREGILHIHLPKMKMAGVKPAQPEFFQGTRERAIPTEPKKVLAISKPLHSTREIPFKPCALQDSKSGNSQQDNNDSLTQNALH